MNITSLPAWHALQKHAADTKDRRISELFSQDPTRFDRFSRSLAGLFVDFSKNNICENTLSLLLSFAEQAGFDAARKAFFGGEKINTTENRAVQHMALRAPEGTRVMIDAVDVLPQVRETLAAMGTFAESVRNGAWTGHSGKIITDVVNIGIGGSSLGPQLVAEALAAFHHPRLRAHFVANVEASDLDLTLRAIDPETTLFIVASKTFTTAETMQNAHIARDWLVKHYGGDMAAVEKHFVAASTNRAAVAAFGIAERNMFPFSDWVGGRYSLWSSIGLSIMLLIGSQNFQALLDGAAQMDAHFKNASAAENIPLLMALVGIWHRNFMHLPAYAVIPYHARLKRLPAFLQQLDMESNGKAVTKDGQPVSYATGPTIFGEPGTDAQHSFFQWLHQSPDVVPVDFIGVVKTPYGNVTQQRMLMANMLAQAEALMCGKDGGAEPHRHFTGNRPSTVFLLEALTPENLGMLLAAYEHKVFAQGALWQINSFDQWGVELGKVLAKTIEGDLTAATTAAHDGSTTGLIHRVKSMLG